MLGRKEKPIMYEIVIDIYRLRRDLLDYFGSAMADPFGMAIMDVSRIERASADELVRIAQGNGFDLNDYRI